MAKLGSFFAVFALISLSSITNAQAATSIQLEEPKSPTNQNTLNIAFVTLDTQNNPITVKCYKKGPSDGGFSQFGSDIVLTPNGGNSGHCAVDSSLINTNGVYQFYAIANSTSSNTVTVDYSTGGPGTPYDYHKDKLNSCDYKVSFKTADDAGKTVKVEIYRSDTASFSADAGSRIATVNISSNQSTSTTNSVPDCAKNYYYVIRAFDAFGNGSGIVGDSETVTVATLVIPAPSPRGAVALAGGAALSQPEVLGQSAASPSSLPGETLGETTPAATTTTPATLSGLLRFLLQPLVLIPGIIVLAVLLYVFISRRPQD